MDKLAPFLPGSFTEERAEDFAKGLSCLALLCKSIPSML